MEPKFKIGTPDLDELRVFENRIEITSPMHGEQTFTFKSITGTQFKEAGRFSVGHIKFTVPGVSRSMLGVEFSANAFTFGRSDNECMREVRDYVNERLAA